jgi:hypothetical protein
MRGCHTDLDSVFSKCSFFGNWYVFHVECDESSPWSEQVLEDANPSLKETAQVFRRGG